MNLGTEFIRLPWRFDARQLARELAQFEDSAWMQHPDGTPGNSAIALISRAGGNNNEFRGAMLPTAHLGHCEYVRQVIASFDEVFGRSRFMRLEAGAEVVLHADFHHHWHNHLRIHIPVTTNPGVTFFCGDAHVHMQAGECWIFDSWLPHRVLNAGDEARVHLVIDTAGSARFWEQADKALAATRSGTSLAEHYVPYEPGRAVSIRTERFNLQPVMSPGEIDGLTADLIGDFARVAANEPQHIDTYRRIMGGFCKDWRALWYTHGLHRSGWPQYAHLVAETSRALPEFDPPVLVSNGMSTAKKAFGGRVLGVALSRDIYEEFINPAVEPAQLAADARGMSAQARAQPQRNAIKADDPCHCGSGLRYRVCHGARA